LILGLATVEPEDGLEPWLNHHANISRVMPVSTSSIQYLARPRLGGTGDSLVPAKSVGLA